MAMGDGNIIPDEDLRIFGDSIAGDISHFVCGERDEDDIGQSKTTYYLLM